MGLYMQNMTTERTITRRRFLGVGAAFVAVDPLLASAKDGKGNVPARVRALYETADGHATDAVWCRRVYLDLAGRIPTQDEAKAFAADASDDKRLRLVDSLLASEDYADYWAMRYCDILRVKSEFPINLWPNAVYVYHRRIRESLAADEPWLTFARTLLTAAGSNFRDAEVNFLRASANRSAEGLSEVASLTFLGQATAEYADYFRSVRYKDTREWKEEIVWCAPGERTPADFADRLAGDLRGRFAAAHAGRVWEWLFCAPPEETRAAALANAFAAADFKLKPFLRQLVLSDDYARGSVTGGFPVRRLDAEVLDDAICALTGAARDFQSIAPEPFTFLPPDRKSVLIEDGSISSAFLILFGRPARDSGQLAERRNEVTPKQRLHLFNSGSLYNRIGKLAEGKAFRKRTPQAMVNELYWKILGRPAAPFEQRVACAEWQNPNLSSRQKWRIPKDIAWCLINSREFLFRI